MCRLRRTRVRVVAASCASLMPLAGCGTNDRPEADQVVGARAGQREPLAAEERFVQRTLVTQADVEKTAAGSPQRAFAEYWAAIDRDDYSTAVLFLADTIRKELDAQYLPASLQVERQNNHPLKPVVRSVGNVRGQASVRYFTRDTSGKLRATSVAMVKTRGTWKIRYSATLAEAYSSTVQQAVQTESDPNGKTPSAAALIAAAAAARAQAKTLGPGATGSAPAQP